MNPVVNKTAPVGGRITVFPLRRGPIELLENVFAQVGLLRHDCDYYLLRPAMVIIFFFFGYRKWFASESAAAASVYQRRTADLLALPGVRPTRGHLVSGRVRMDVPDVVVSGLREQDRCDRWGLGFHRYLRRHGHIIPFMPQRWNAAGGGFSAITGNVPFLMKDVVRLATSFYLVKQVVQRSLLASATDEPAYS